VANWASIAEVLEYTGSTVTDAQITVANGVIDLFSGVTDLARDNLSDRDLRLLSKAAAYQAVWQIAQVDVFTRTDVATSSQDGASFTAPTGNPDFAQLAPLAKRCLDRLSWRKTRSVRVRRGGQVRYTTLEAYQQAWVRDAPGVTPGWEPV
jgi:hypothetical protein